MYDLLWATEAAKGMAQHFKARSSINALDAHLPLQLSLAFLEMIATTIKEIGADVVIKLNCQAATTTCGNLYYLCSNHTHATQVNQIAIVQLLVTALVKQPSQDETITTKRQMLRSCLSIC